MTSKDPKQPPSRSKSILLVNPWIHDFAAYDLWTKPLGLLYIGAILRSRGYRVSLLDLLEFTLFPRELTGGLKTPVRKGFGQGHYFKEIIPKPKALGEIRRHYRRYGVPPEIAGRFLSRAAAPELVLVTSSMTYWYPGVFETIEFLRGRFPRVPVLLGGTYATLCQDHARRFSGADRVLPGPWDGGKMDVVAEYLGDDPRPTDPNFTSWPDPAFDLYPAVPYVCLLTRCGCPFSCTYCASSTLAENFASRAPAAIAGEIARWNEKFGVRNFAFYDDALLLNPFDHIAPMLQKVIDQKIACSFHTPNALHVRAIGREVADLLFRAGFKTLRLGLETSDERLQDGTGGKVDNDDFRRTVGNLKRAGYKPEEIGVYLLAGLPGQKANQVSESIAFVKESGARPILVEYSPIPGTAMFEEAKQASRFDLENEPLFHNNSILPCGRGGLTGEDYRRLKDQLRN